MTTFTLEKIRARHRACDEQGHEPFKIWANGLAAHTDRGILLRRLDEALKPIPMTRLGWVNFWFWQWLFVRRTNKGTWLKWVVPLTGWWNDYRYLLKRNKPVTITNVVEFDPGAVELDEPKILEIIRNRKPLKPAVFLPDRSRYLLALNVAATMLSSANDSEPIDTFALSYREAAIELLKEEGYIEERQGGAEEVDGSLELKPGGYFWTKKGKELLCTPFGYEEGEPE